MKTVFYFNNLSKTIATFAMSVLMTVGSGLYANHQCFCPQIDSLALAEFYKKTGGPAWTSSSNWLTSPLSTWQGVTLTDGRVTALQLPYNKITGSLPIEITYLTELKVLVLNGNLLSGNLPFTMVFLKKLEKIDLSANQLNGVLPVYFGYYSNLVDLDLSKNQFTGAIPSTIGNLKNSKTINLSNNQLNGNIPSSIGNLRKLEELYLSNNKIEGSIPSNISKASNLSKLYLDNNLLTGTISSKIGKLDSLVYFVASQNKLSGPVPAQVADMEKIFHFDIKSNEISSLPNLSTVQPLVKLIVGDNKLTFEHLEPNIAKLPGRTYVPQDSVGTVASVSVCEGDSLVLSSDFVGHSVNNRYQFYKSGNSVVSPIISAPVWVLHNVTAENSGVYYARMTNTVVRGLTIYRQPIYVTVEQCSDTLVSSLKGSTENSLISTASENGLTKAYPVPYSNQVTIEVATSDAENLTISVFDESGNKVANYSDLKTKQAVTVGGELKSGIYYFQASYNGKKDVVKVIKH